MMMWRSKHRTILLVMFAVLLGAWAFWYSPPTNQLNENPPATFEPYQATLTGTYICLPHTNASGPQTLECAFGLQVDENTYYALDFNQFSPIPPNIPTGSRVKTTGTVTPVEYLSSDHWRKYPITGIFSVTDSFEAI